MISFNNEVDMEVVNSYGMYSFNLNSLWNSGGFSTILPQLNKASDYQYEGYGYLGFGTLIIIGIAIIMGFFSFKKLIQKTFLIPLFVIVFLYLLFAITNIVTYGDKTLFNYNFW